MGCAGAKDQQEEPAQTQRSIEKRLECECGGVAADYAECAVCFEPLPHEPCCMLFCRGQRSCRHLMHTRCAKQLQDFHLQSFCPECRTPFDSLVALPRLENDDARAWFDAVDSNRDGRLSQQEVLDTLKCQYRLDWRRLEAHIEQMWPEWDKSASGDLSYDELICEGGLLQYITGGCEAQEELFYSPKSSPPSPPISEMGNWFRYWDTDGDCSLDRQEVLRGMIKTFGIGTGQWNRVVAMKATLEEAWPCFDVDGSDSISLAEFVMPNGLGETLRLTLSTETKSPRPIARLESCSFVGG